MLIRERKPFPVGHHSRSMGLRRESKPMIVTRAEQLQPNQKRGILMTTKRTVLNIIAFLTFSTMLMAGQTQMPASSPATDKADSAAPRTLTGTVSDAMCGAHHMAKTKALLSVLEHA
jgi:hypothetical protein